MSKKYERYTPGEVTKNTKSRAKNHANKALTIQTSKDNTQSNNMPTVFKLKDIKKRHFIEVFWICDGNISKACDNAKISRATYYHWLRNDKQFASMVEEKTNQLNDEMQQILIDKARTDKGTTELIFYLKNKHNDYKPKKETLAVENREGDKVTRFVLSRG